MEWKIHAARVEYGPATLVFADAVATWQTDRRWRLRADRLVARRSVADPGRLSWIWARGRVRLIGPDPMYVTGRRALGFARTARVDLAGTSGASILGSGWQLTGRNIEVDMSAGQARLVGPGPIADRTGGQLSLRFRRSPDVLDEVRVPNLGVQQRE